MKKAEHPFHFVTQESLIELTGQRAHNLQEMLAYLKTAPGAVIYYHTHHFLKQHQFLSPEPANDFAYWVTNVLQEDRLGEQLASIDTVRFPSIRALAEKIVSVIEAYLAKSASHRTAPPNEEFHFMRSRSFLLPTSHSASDLAEFASAVEKIGHASLYHHMFESRMRIGKETNDFSLWLESELGEKALARGIAALDPYTQTMEGLRNQILYLVRSRLAQLHEGVPVHAA